MVMGEFSKKTKLLVVGGGPGGYAAAFRAADLGLDVVLLSDEERPGGVCLHRGCIPSKTLLHAASLIRDARRARAMGLDFGEPEIDLEALRKFEADAVDKLTSGLEGLAKKRGVELIRGRGVFESSTSVRIADAGDEKESEFSRIEFEHAVLATGSEPLPLPGSAFGKRIMDAAAALALEEIPDRLLIVGGGYIGLELGSVYAALGSRVTLVEMTDTLVPGVDPELVEPLASAVDESFEAIHTGISVASLEERDDDVLVRFEGDDEALSALGENAGEGLTFERVLVAIGRGPRSEDIGLEETGVERDERGFVQVDEQRRTGDEHIFAIGDVAGEPLLAHKAMAEGRVVAEVIAGQASAYDARAVPAVIYTEPAIAWCGLSEDEAREEGLEIAVAKVPWRSVGRAATLGLESGLTKIVADARTQRVLGVGLVGENVGELISEAVLAIEMGAVAEDLARAIHPHPTLSESLGEAAGAFFDASTHVMPGSARAS